MREGSAAVNIGHQIHVGSRLERYAHVDDIARAQVHLGRAAGALDHHQLKIAQQRMQALAHRLPQQRLARQPWRGGDRRIVATQHDHLRLCIALWLEQHRLHARFGRDAGGHCLDILGAAYL
jgi:hypothetical protein